jgi:hypothetical protein
VKAHCIVIGLLLLALLACGGGDSATTDLVPLGAVGSAGSGPPAVPGLRPGVIELWRWRDPRQRVVIDKAGVALGPVGEPLERTLFLTHDRLNELHGFLRTYSRFRARMPEGELVFGGQGPFRPGATERRMILEWARLVAAEAMGGRGSSDYGLMLAWHRGEGTASCDDLAVYLTGEVRAGSCSWEEEVSGRLRPEVLARFYGWFDHLKPFQVGGGIRGGAEQEQFRMIFAGRGRGEASDEETATLRSLATALHRELAARRPAPLRPQPPPEEAVTDTKMPGRPQPPPAPEPPPGPALLLPPETPGSLPLPEAKLPPYIPPPPVQKKKPEAPPAAAPPLRTNPSF